MLGADAGEFLTHLLDHIRPLPAQEVQPGLDRVEGFRVELREGERLQLGFDRLHTDAFGKWGVDFHRLAGDALATVELADRTDGAHVVQPVGQFDEQDTNVLAHRQDELAEILGLLGAIRLQFEAGQLGHAIDEASDFSPELLGHLRQGNAGILDDIMQQSGADRGRIQPIAGQNIGHRQRMDDVGLAIVTLLRAVSIGGDAQGFGDQADIGLGVIGANTLDQRPPRRVDHRTGGAVGGKGGAGAPEMRGADAHGRLPTAATAQFGFNGSCHIVRRQIFAIHRQRRRFVGVGDVLQAENVLLGRDKIENLLIGGLGFRRAREGFQQIRVELFQRDRLIGDFTQCHDGIFVVVTVNGDFFAARDVARPLGGQQNKLKAVGNALHAIFDGYARHGISSGIRT